MLWGGLRTSVLEKDFIFVKVTALLGFNQHPLLVEEWKEYYMSHSRWIAMVLDRNSWLLLLRNYTCIHHALKVIAYFM